MNMDLLLEHDFTFNPDGGGRVQLRWSAPEGPDPDEFLRSELQGAQGVEAWADVSCNVDDGRLCFTATAWFPDVSRLRFHCQGFHSNVLDFAVTATDAGDVVVSSREQAQPLFEPVAPGADAAALQQAMAQEREKLTMARGFIDELFGGLCCRAVLRLPGRIAEAARGERVADNAVRVCFEGRQLLTVIDRLLQDDALMLDLMQKGPDGPQEALELLGDSGPVRLCTTGGAATQFDYAEEVAAAKAMWTDLQQSLAPPARLMQPGEPLANVRVLASKLVREADSDRGLCPMGQNFVGLSLVLAGDLPEPATAAEEGTVEAIVTDTGQDLTPEREWDRRISFPRLCADGRTVYFELDLPLPQAGSDGFAEIRGRVQCQFARGIDEVDLGFAQLADDSEGTVHGAKLSSCSSYEGRWSCELQLQIARERVQALLLVIDGEVVTMEQHGYSACNDECTLQYECEVEPPPDARLVLRLVSELQPMELPFALGPVNLQGRPR